MDVEGVLGRARARSAAARKSRNMPSDTERISALPRKELPAGAALARRWTERLRRTPKARPLRPIQGVVLETCAWALENTERSGAYCSITVGGGKTLIGWLAGEVLQAKRVVLLLDNAVRDQYANDLYEWSQEYKFTPPTVVYYSQLSQPGATDLLRKLSPDLIIADEAQNLKNADAARTKRFNRYMEENPDTRFIAMSGTITTTGIEDFAHLMILALREYSPIPLSPGLRERWASVLDSEVDATPDAEAWRYLRFLNEEAARCEDRKSMRESFRKLTDSIPGTVATRGSSCDARLILTDVRPDLSDEVKEAINIAHDDYVLPDGSDLVDALQAGAALAQLSSGFYYEWEWPNGTVDEDWVEARSAWGKECRTFLKYRSREGVDSPLLLDRWLRDTDGRYAQEAWHALRQWDEQRHKPQPPTRTVWLDLSVIEYAVDWLDGHDNSFVWFSHKATGEALQALGVEVFWEGLPKHPENRRCALSTSVFHKGMNFQAWSDQLVLEPPPNAATWEQLLGRQHRAGQLSPVVRCSIAQHTWPLRERMRKAFARSYYIEQTTGQPQKLLFAETEGFQGVRHE